MEISWLGHACFRLRAKDGVVVTDPYDSSAGYPPLKVTATIVTVSHDDPKHNHTAAVSGNPTVVDRPGEYEIASIPIVGVRTYRDKTKGATVGKNVSYLFEMDDVTIVHLGAIGHVPAAETVQQLGEVGVLLVPVGGKTTLDATGAAETISLLQPRIVVPMHYRTDRDKEDLDTVDRFLREMGVSQPQPQARLAVTKSSLPDSLTVVLLSSPS